jgi:hypothetical protein
LLRLCGTDTARSIIPDFMPFNILSCIPVSQTLSFYRAVQWLVSHKEGSRFGLLLIAVM